MSWVPGAIVPIIAAAAKKKRDEEEEEMTRYTAEELQEDWEFKIVRNNFGAFSDSQKLGFTRFSGGKTAGGIN